MHELDGHDEGYDKGVLTSGVGAKSRQPPRKLSLSSEALPDVGSRQQLVLHQKSYLDPAGKRVSSKINSFYIHPDGSFRLSWDLASMLLILMLMVLVPMEMSFYFEEG